MPACEVILLEARIVGVIKEGVFFAELGNGHRIVAHTKSSQLSTKGSDPLPIGSLVKVRISPFDMVSGTIVWEE